MLFRAAYCFFDAAFWLETDAQAFLARFDEAYGRFRVADAAGAPVYQVLLAAEPSATIGGEVTRSGDAEALGHYAYNAILNAATARVASHYLFHGAALSTSAGQGVILAGDAGLGKSSLTLALLQRGWGFLSDDVAAVDRTAGLLYPFPRPLGQRFAGCRPGEKRLIDAGEVALPCPACFLFSLADPAARTIEEPWYLVLDRVDEPLLADLRIVPGVQEVHVARAAPYPALRLRLAPGAVPVVEPAIGAACRRHATLVFELTHGRESAPCFGGEPRLVALSALDAARELLRHFKGGPRSTLLLEFGGSAARLYLALTGLAAGMTCWRLEVGRMESQVEMIISAVAQSK